MFAKEIPDFLVEVMRNIEIGIDRVAQQKLEEIGVDKSLIHVRYPEHVELMLNVEAKIDDGSDDGGWENQSLWVKIPWPKKVG